MGTCKGVQALVNFVLTFGSNLFTALDPEKVGYPQVLTT